MSTKPEIALGQIKARTTSKTFSRGQGYYQSDAIFGTIQRGNQIEAKCHGSYPEPYHVSVAFYNSEIIDANCNCEYDWGGDCKHIIALLLTYLHSPEDFDDRPPIEDALDSRTKEDLIDIIQQMLLRYPDLQDIVDSPTPNEVIKGVASLDMLSMRQELRNAFQNPSYDRYGNYSADQYHKVAQYKSNGEKFSEYGDWESALAIYCMIIDEFVAIGDEYYDEDGDLAYLVDTIVEQIPDCLDHTDIVNDDTERMKVLTTLLGIYIWDIDFGGIDIGGSAPDIVLQYMKQRDVDTIRQKINIARERKAQSRYGNWAIEAYDRFLINLDVVDNVDPEITLKRLREEGMDELLVSKLLELGRVDEATTTIRNNFTGSYELRKVFRHLDVHGHHVLATQIAEETLYKMFDGVLASWLIDRYEIQQNLDKVLEWRLKLMRHQPDVEVYKNIKSTAQSLNQWEEIQPQIIDNLQTRKAWDTLTQVYLVDEEWELAWQTLPKVNKGHYGYEGYRLEFQVAEASRHVMPERAIPIYIKRARGNIDQRKRDYYREAASLLSQVQHMYDQLDEFEKWETLITKIREEFNRLPALQDELNKAGI